MPAPLPTTSVLLAGLLLPGPLLMGQPPAATWLSQASQAASQGDSGQAVVWATRAIQSNPGLASAYYLRGREHFRLGKVHQSVLDFDKFIELEPESERRLWERGISCYYDGQYAQGARQFALYQTFHDNDVENSVWRFLCVARQHGLSRARDTMLPIKDDRRVPMMQIYEMFRGRLQPADVFQAARREAVDEPSANRRLFYAHLYVGLYHEAQGDDEGAKKHILLAADKHKIGHYMWDVAHVHAARFRDHDKTSTKPH